MTDEPCTDSRCAEQTHRLAESIGRLDSRDTPQTNEGGELERLRAEVLADKKANTNRWFEIVGHWKERAESAEAALRRGVMILDRLIESVESDDSGDPTICHDYDCIDAGECALLADLRRLRAALDGA